MVRTKHTAVVFMGLILIGCHLTGSERKTSSLSQDSISVRPTDSTRTPKLDKRMTIVGDFDGDGRQDTLRESYISALTNEETPKQYDSVDYLRNMDLTAEAQPITRLLSSIPGVDTFTVTDNFQQSGISCFSNLGDVNGDGTDEFGYFVNWADMSSLNTYVIMTIKNNKVTELFAFPINEMVSFDKDELIDGQHLVKATGPKAILYKFYSDSATVETGTHRF